MQLVGAPQAYIRGPFVMEGVLQGGVGALLALAALGVTFFALRGRYLTPLASAMNMSSIHFLPVELCLLLVARRDGGRVSWRPGGRLERVELGRYGILTAVLRRRYTGIHQSDNSPARTCMPRFVPDSRPISAQHPITEFYREEFLKHHRCLQRQRAYYSESAITDVEAALTKIIGKLDQLSSQDERRTAGQLTPQEIRRRDRPFGLVRPQAHTLTRSHSQLRQDLLAIVRAGIGACAADALVERALRCRCRAGASGLRIDGGPEGPHYACRVIAAGKAAPAMAAAAARRLGARIRAGLVIGVTEAAAPPGFDSIVGGHPLPTAASEAAGRKALALAASLAADETLLVLLSGGASALMAVPADGVTLDDKRRDDRSGCCGPAPTFTR